MDYQVNKNGKLIEVISEHECIIDYKVFYIQYDYIELDGMDNQWYVFYNCPYLGFPNVFSVVYKLKNYLKDTKEFKYLLIDKLKDYTINFWWDYDYDNKFWSINRFDKEIIIDDEDDIKFLERLFIRDKYDFQGTDSGHYMITLSEFTTNYFEYKKLIDRYIFL